MSNTKVVTSNLQYDSKDLLSISANMHEQGGTIQIETAETLGDQIDSKCNIEGIEGIAKRIGSRQSASIKSNILELDLGQNKANNYITSHSFTDDINFYTYEIHSIIDGLPDNGLTINYQCYNLLVENFDYSGKLKDAMQYIASMLYGKVLYYYDTNEYKIISGDVPIEKLKSSVFSLADVEIISKSVETVKQTEALYFGSEIIKVAEQIADVKIKLLELEYQRTYVAPTYSSSKKAVDKVSFSFGTKNGFSPIPSGILIDSGANWEYWSYDVTKGIKNSNSKYNYYFRVEIETEPITNIGSKQPGIAKGLTDIANARILYPLNNIPTDSQIYGRGYASNLTTTGLPDLFNYTKVKNSVDKASADSTEDTYHWLYDVQTRAVKSPDGIRYIPYLVFRINPFLYNDIYADLKAKKGTDPDLAEINNALAEQLYEVQLEILAEYVDITSDSNSMQYKGYLDKHGRLITPSGQVLLYFDSVSHKFYPPVTGMDMSFNLKLATNNDTYGINGVLSSYVDDTAIKNGLAAAFNDLAALATRPDIKPVAVFSGTSNTYPRILLAIPDPPIYDPQTHKILDGQICGIVYNNSTAQILDSTGEPTIPLSLQSTSNIDIEKKKLSRTLKCLESKLTLLKKCIARYKVSIELDKLIKDITTYKVLISQTQSDSLVSLKQYRTAYENSCNQILASCDLTTSGSRPSLNLSITTPNMLPTISSKVSIDNKSYYITDVNVNGLTTTIIALGDLNV